MRLACAAVAFAVAVPSLASANPIEIGAGIGKTQSSSDAESNQGTLDALNLYGRISLFGPIGLQAEIGKVDTGSQSTVRTASLLGVIELTQGRFVPVLLAGAGVDQSDDTFGTLKYAHAEVGLGLAFRISDGLTIGVDAREGTRKAIDNPDYAQPLANGGGVIDLYAPRSISEGEYRTVRATVGVRF